MRSLIINGPRNAGNHALCYYLKELGFKADPGLFEDGIYDPKDGLSPRRLIAWGDALDGIWPGMFGRSHSYFNPDLLMHTVLHVRRAPTSILVSSFRKRCLKKQVEETPYGLRCWIESDAFYNGHARPTVWDNVPGIHVFDFESLFLEPTKRAICDAVEVPFEDVDFFGRGHNYTGQNKTIDDLPYRLWFDDELEASFWERWHAVRGYWLDRAEKAMAHYGVR